VLARHLHDQLAVPSLGRPPLRDRGRLAQQLRARHHHDGRGLAQQPPPLPGVDAPGLQVVGDRLHLLHPADARGGGADLGFARDSRAHRG
jgi:hypothetical protein